MNYLRRLYCYLYGHETYTVTLPLMYGDRHEVLDYCMRCEQSMQRTQVTEE